MIESSDALKKAGVPRGFWGARLSTIPDDAGYRRAVAGFIADAEGLVQDGKGLYLFGSTGSGKTSAAVVCLKAARAAGKSVMFVPAQSLVQTANKEWAEGTTFWDRAVMVDCLILDSMGEEYPEAAGVAMVSKLISMRIFNQKSTLITSSVDPRPIKNGKGSSMFETRYGESTYGRLRGSVHPVLCDGVDWRAADLTSLAKRLGQ